MKYLLIFLTAFMLSVSSCAIDPIVIEQAKRDRILVLGDSWGFFSGIVYNSFEVVADERNLDYDIVDFSISGLRADQLLDPIGIVAVQLYIASIDRLEYVVLSVGGNDIVEYWDTAKTSQETTDIIASIGDNIIEITKRIREVTDAKIIILGLD